MRKYNIDSTIVCTASTLGHHQRLSLEEIDQQLSGTNNDYQEIPYTTIPIGSSPFPDLNKIRKVFNDVDFDLVYFTNAYAFQDLTMRLLKQIHKKPVIAGQHALLLQDSVVHDLYVKTVSRALMHSFDACHALSHHDAQVFERWGIRNIYLIPPGIDPNQFQPPSQSIKNERFNVLFVGRLSLEKGFDIFCDAIARINQTSYNLNFIVVGSGELESLARQVESKYNNVTYLGHVPHTQMTEIYQKSDLFIISSRRESFGIAGIEAQSSGLPVIGTNVVGPSETILDGVTGSIIERDSIDALALEILQYYKLWATDFWKYLEIRKRARKRAEMYSWDTVISQVYRMFETIIVRSR